MEKYVYRRSDRHLPPASLIVFAALLCGFALVNLFWPKRENSELENRKLAQMPVFSVKTLLNGKWQDDFSTYLQDQVALRDGWINLESAVNALAFGKTEESGILNGKDGWMCTTKEEWVNALEALVTDEKARKAMGEAAHQKVMEHYLTVNTGKDAMEELLCSESYTK